MAHASYRTPPAIPNALPAVDVSILEPSETPLPVISSTLAAPIIILRPPPAI